MQLFTDDIIAGLLERSLETAEIDANGWRDVGRGPGSVVGQFIKWHTFTDLEKSVLDDVRRIRSHPLVPAAIPIYGYVYDVKSGRLIEVEAASRAGAAPTEQAATKQVEAHQHEARVSDRQATA
jgi:carbonic anhydrase